MIDRALGITPPESYYFQLYPVNLILLSEPVPTQETKFKFSIYKGLQKFDQNKIMTDANFIQTNGTYVMPFRGCQLNFYLPNFNKNRKILFTLKLNEKDDNEEYEIGGIDIDPANFITQFQNNGQNRFQQKIQISQQYALQFEIYLQKSRFALQKVVKSFQGERNMKSPARQRISPTRQRHPVYEKTSQYKESRSPQIERVEQEIQSVPKSSTKQISLAQEHVPQHQETQLPVSYKLSQQPQQNPPRPASFGNQLPVHQNQNLNDKSEKSEQIVSPVVRSRQMKRTTGKNQSTIRGSVRLEKDAEVPVIQAKKDVDNWTNHIPLVLFTILGILAIYWVMHPTSRV